MKRALGGVVGLSVAAASRAQNRHFDDWPTGTDPREVGTRVAERFIPTPHMVNDRHGPQALHYAHVATWTGALRFASVTKNENLRRRLVERFDQPAQHQRINRNAGQRGRNVLVHGTELP